MRSPEKKYWPSIWLSYLLFFLTCGSVWADVSGEITVVKLDASQKRVVIESKGTVGKHLARVIGRPNRLVMYFEEMSIGKVPTTIKCGDLNINEIRSSNARGQARVVLDFQENPVPPFHVRKDGNNVFIIFGSPLNADKGIKEFVSDPVANLVAPAAPEMGAAPVRTNNQEQNTRKQFEAVASQGGIKPEQFVLSPAAHKDGNVERNGSEKDSETHGSRSLKTNTAEAKKLPILLAQNTEMRNPAASTRTPGEKVEAADPRANTPVPAQQNEIAGSGGQMVREVRPPVTPPTPDPRLVVQEITELKFIQVGHNSRLIIRGGDHLDYRMTKVSPTKMRLDLINAEIPKVHQKPLKTDLFSTSVEMIVPGSQTIFIQLKDSVPHQVEKKKGVLMIDFPPPRFQMTSDQKGSGKPGDTAGREAFQQAGETRREAVRVMKEEEILKANESRRKALEVLQKQQEEADKQRSDLIKRYRIAPDPAVFSKPVTMDFQGISLRNAFRLLAEQAGINIIVDDKVTGSTTLRLFQVPLGQVIDTIMNTQELDREMFGNVMRVGKRDDIKKLKEEKQKEYGVRMREVSKRLEEIQKDIQKNQADIDKSMKDLEKVDTGETTTADDIRTEEVGEAGCIKVKGEDVCFFYATVKLVYAKPQDVVTVLECMFNLNCKGRKGPGQNVDLTQELQQQALEGLETGKQSREAFSQQLQGQGFSPDSAGYQQRMMDYERTQSDTTRARASIATAVQMGKQQAPAQVTLPYGTDPDLALIIGNSMLWPDEPNRMIFIKDTQDRIAQMKKIIYTLDVPTPQVLVEARLVQAIRGWSRGIGIAWGGRNNQTGFVETFKKGFWGVEGQGAPLQTGIPLTNGAVIPPIPEGTAPPNQMMINLPAVAGTLMGAGIQFGLLGTNYITELDARLSIGEAMNKLKIISRPKVQVMDNMKALIKNGVSIPYVTTGIGGSTQTQMIDADLKLEVKPKIYIDGRIKMDVKVTDDEPEAVLGTLSIRRRNAETFMIVKDGETAVIGGILRSTNSTDRGGWPGLMNVPVVNLLFSNKNSSNNVTELLVFITPAIVKRPPAAS